MESMYYYSPQGCLRVSRARQTDVLLPSLIAEGLSANDRVKARLSRLAGGRAACASSQFDLGAECSAAGIDLGMRIPPEHGSQSPEAASEWDFGTGGHSADDNDCSIA